MRAKYPRAKGITNEMREGKGLAAVRTIPYSFCTSTEIIKVQVLTEIGFCLFFTSLCSTFKDPS